MICRLQDAWMRSSDARTQLSTARNLPPSPARLYNLLHSYHFERHTLSKIVTVVAQKCITDNSQAPLHPAICLYSMVIADS